jgi:outer membrane protein
MRKTILLFAATFCFVGTLFAQSPKLGYINSNELLSQMPEVRAADSTLQVYARSYQEQLETMGKEYQKKIQEYQAQEKTMSDAVKEVKAKEIQQLGERIQSTEQSAQEKISKRREEVYSPIIEKAENAIKEVGKSNNYDYIFDTSSGALLYYKDADDILPLVKAKLGIK